LRRRPTPRLAQVTSKRVIGVAGGLLATGAIRRGTFGERIAMSLKVELKPGEKLIIGNCVITNSDQRTRLTIDGKLPILREKDILTPDRAKTPAELIYLAVQLMYLEGGFRASQTEYLTLVNAMITLTPASAPLIEEVSNQILTGNLYKALKAARKLIQFEKEHPSHDQPGGAGLPAGGDQDDPPA
jgi:flagellar protein FlbT